MATPGADARSCSQNESSAAESVTIKVEAMEDSEMEDLPLAHFLDATEEKPEAAVGEEQGGNLDANANVKEIEISLQVGSRTLRPRIPKLEPTMSELVDRRLEELLRPNKKRTYVRYKPLKEHKCEPCGKKFSSKKTKILHDFKHHGIKTEPGRDKNICQKCGHSFDSWKLLVKHEKESRHFAKIPCEICDRSFSRAYISYHIRSHSEENSFLCTLCGAKFHLKGSFDKHNLRCLNIEKKLKCTFCDRRFHTKAKLRDHERIHTKEKPFVCETCGKGFRLNSKLKIHQLGHTGLRPYVCDLCGRRFRQSAHLKEHNLIHTGVKPYACNLCGAAFTQGHSLKTHQLKHEAANADEESSD